MRVNQEFFVTAVEICKSKSCNSESKTTSKFTDVL